MRGPYVLAAAVVLVALAPAGSPSAHEIPKHVTVHAFAKPERDRLRVLLRVPLEAMRDIQFPQRGEGFLDIARSEPALRDALTQWMAPSLEIFENDAPVPDPVIVAARVSLPSDRSFLSYTEALAHVTGGTLAGGTQLPWPQAQLDALLEYPIVSDQSDFSIRPGFARLGIDVRTVFRLVTPGGVRAFEFRGDPGLVRLDPRWHQAAGQFVKGGFLHILDGVDHLLFLLCLVIPFRRLRPLIFVVTAFTAAHSVSLAAAAFNLVPDALWFPPLVETLTAASILYMAIENIVASPTLRRRILLAFGFGLVHGFGFSFALRDTLQFAGTHLLTSLLAFNVGVEIGQVLVLLALVPALGLFFRFGLRERIGTVVFSVLVGHVSWHWMADRWTALRQFPAPELDLPILVWAIRSLLVIVCLAGVVWLTGRWRARTARHEAPAAR